MVFWVYSLRQLRRLRQFTEALLAKKCEVSQLSQLSQGLIPKIDCWGGTRQPGERVAKAAGGFAERIIAPKGGCGHVLGSLLAPARTSGLPKRMALRWIVFFDQLGIGRCNPHQGLV